MALEKQPERFEGYVQQRSRIANTRTVVVHDIVASNAVDEHVQRLLKQKRDHKKVYVDRGVK